MKIGILSMQRVINYGSYMQALSLKKILEGLGCEVTFVDYKAKPSIQHRRSLRYWLGRVIKALKNTWLFWTVANIYRGRPIGYRIPKGYTEDELRFIPALKELGVDYENQHYHTKVDALIIGSDEVFNCLQDADNVGFSPELFGKNNNANKLMSYAASFGNTTLERLKEYKVDKKVGGYLKKFDYISVRDENSANIVRTLTGKEPFQHLDPVLIGGVEKIQWKGNNEKDYIAIYAYSNRVTETEDAEIYSFAKKTNLKTVCINGTQKYCKLDSTVSCAPDEILPYFKNASYVVTDTFHGTIFSIIHHIPFAVYCRRPKDVSYSNSEKLLDLLKKFNMLDRVVSEDNSLETVLSKEIDFEAADLMREKEKEASVNYLKNALGL